MIRFNDLGRQQTKISGEISSAIDKVLVDCNFIMGSEVKLLESELQKYVGVDHCITTSSGTDSLLMALLSLGVGAGDAIFLPSFTFVSTIEVVVLLGATPIIIDVNEKSFNIDTELLSDAISEVTRVGELKPRAIISVDIFGLPCDYNAIKDISKKFSLKHISDAAQSFGARYQSRQVCSIADITTTSFFPTKPLGCYGDGGAVFTDDSDLSACLSSVRSHGKGIDKYDNVRVGINGRLDTIQAAVLIAKLSILEREIATRDKLASNYRDNLKNKFIMQSVDKSSESAWAQFSLLTDNRDQLMESLYKLSIPTAIYYRIPLHYQPAYHQYPYYCNSKDVSNELSKRVVSIPVHAYLTDNEQDLIINSLNRCA